MNWKESAILAYECREREKQLEEELAERERAGRIKDAAEQILDRLEIPHPEEWKTTAWGLTFKVDGVELSYGRPGYHISGIYGSLQCPRCHKFLSFTELRSVEDVGKYLKELPDDDFHCSSCDDAL